MRSTLILTLQVFPATDGGVRVDLVSTRPPDGDSRAFEVMARELALLAEKIISNHGLDLLGSRNSHISEYLVSRQQMRTGDEA